MPKRTWIPALVTAVVAVFVWAVFHPALMSVDSLNQYAQALSRRFTDWHPPVISLALSGVLALGGSLGVFMLGQCLAGAFGVTAFAAACLEWLHGGRTSRRRAAWTSVLVFLVLLALSPLAFYLMTLWKDVWTFILLLWMGVLALKLSRAGERLPPLLVGGFVLLAVLYGMVRHNAIVTLPIVGLFLWIEARRRSIQAVAALLLAVSPLALCWSLGAALPRAFDIRSQHPGDTVLVLDLVGICVEDRAACESFTYLQWFLRDDEDLGGRYRPGDMGSIYWEKPALVDFSIFKGRREVLLDEYRRAARRFPLLLARVKLEAFWPLLQFERTAYFFNEGLPPNAYGLALNERFRGFREGLEEWVGTLGEDPVLRWISGVHLVWMIANAAWVAALLARARRAGDRGLSSLAVFLLVPLAYSFSYLAASPVPDYRFLYPSTLTVQVLTLAWLLHGRARRSRTT